MDPKSTKDIELETGYLLAHPEPGDEVVISGIAGIYPESIDIGEFCKNIFNKKNLTTLNETRWKFKYPELQQYTAKIPNVEKFDAAFFGIEKNNASIMDIAYRVTLELVYESIWDAGMSTEEIKGSRTGVFTATCMTEGFLPYWVYDPQPNAIYNTNRGVIAQRIPYHLQIEGPCIVVDSACSASLYATYLAHKAMREGQIDNAIVIGSNTLFQPFYTVQFARLGVLNPDGKVKCFSEDADGYTRGESATCIFLQKAKNARRIYGQILHAKANCDGYKPEGITCPSREIQVRLQKEVLEEAGVNPHDVKYVECHGTGTKVGDPIEVNGVYDVFCQNRKDQLLIGSVKSNIGHSEGGAGTCAISKAIIMMNTGYIPPNINFTGPKAGIKGLEDGKIKVVLEKTKFEGKYITINGFGFGGANSNILMKDIQKEKVNNGLPNDNLPRLVCYSGRTQEALKAFSDDFGSRCLDAEYVGLLHEVFKHNVDGHFHRGYTIINKKQQLGTRAISYSGVPKPLWFVFSGLGSEWLGMGAQLMKIPNFASTVKKCQECLSSKNIDITAILTSKDEKMFEDDINVTVGITVMQLALVDLLNVLKIVPDYIFGFSIGNLACAYADSCLTLNQALLCSYHIGESSKNKENNTVLLDNLKKVIPSPKNWSPKWQKIEETKMTNTCSAEYLVYSLFQSFSLNKIYPKRAVVVEIAPHGLLQRVFKQLSNGTTQNLTLIDKENSDCITSLLESIGEMYLYGQNARVQELYPKIQFPVSRGTRMISPLIKWNHEMNFPTFDSKNFEPDGTHKEFCFTQMYTINSSVDKKFISDHVIDVRILYPGTGYLNLVWQTFRTERFQRLGYDEGSVVFEDVHFLNAVNLNSGTTCNLFITYYPTTGRFEIVDGTKVISCGFVRSPTVPELHEREEIPAHRYENPSDYVPLQKKDIYKELKLRGYNYGPNFIGIEEFNDLTSSGKLKWNNNYITFMDTMLQIFLINTDNRGLFVPTIIKKVIINKKKHTQFIENLLEDSLIPVYHFKKSNKVVSGGISINSLQFNAISRKDPREEPVLESYKFIPNLNNSLTLEESVRVIVQVALENVTLRQVKTLEVLEINEEYIISPMVLTILEDLPLMQANTKIITQLDMEPIPGVTISNGKISEETDCLLVILKNVMDRPKLVEDALKSLLPNGFLVLRESLNFNFPKFMEKSSKMLPTIDVILEHYFKNEQILLVRQRTETKLKTAVKIGNDPTNFDWLPNLQHKVKKDPNAVIYAEGCEINGALGLINCIRKEPGTEKVRAVIIFDDFDIKFDLRHEFYVSQLRKGLGINILKQGVWGTYRHLKLPPWKNIPVEHAFVNPMVRGELSSLAWLEKHESRSRAEHIPVKVYYASLNFRDVMTVSGRVPPEVVAKDRFEIECLQGLEYSGRTLDGRRVMGTMDCQGLATDVEAKLASLWYVPDNWTLEQAATVPVVYSTVYYALIMEGRIRKGQSILIHSGTGGIGQAAINVALHYGCTIFTTVGTPEKRDFIKTHWPQIKDSHIGNSRDTSFEQMIMEQTQGRGVDYVLNSLADDKLQATIRCLAQFGKFLEIGKFDLIKDTNIRLELFRKHASYHGVMLDQVPKGSINLQLKITLGLNQLLKEGAVKPLNSTVFGVDQVKEAFRYMGTGKHTGKIMLKIRDEEKQRVVQPPAILVPAIARYIPSPDKSYIITGGLGGFGLELADWLIIRGVKNLVLSSRKGITTGYQSFKIKFWKTYGVHIKISKANIHTLEGCKTVIKEACELGPVEGIFNLAVVLQDAVLDNQTKETFETSFGPKPIATKHFDELSRRYCQDLRVFVVFSSVSCGRGNAGQTNYGMGNSIMERICEKRKRDGYPALAIQWGAVGNVGLVAEMQENEDLTIGGTLQQRISSCLSVLDQFLRQEEPVVSSMVVAEKKSIFSGGNCVEAVFSILGVKNLNTISTTSTLSELGLDSITSLEIKQTLERDYDLFLSQEDIRNLTIEKLQKLSAQQRNQDQQSEVIEQTLDLLSRLFGDFNIDRTPIVEMSSLQGKNKIILIPGIEGSSAVMAPLAKNLKGEIICLQYAVVEKQTTIQEIATNYYNLIQKDDDNFTIIAHSIGTLIALELATMLETNGKKCLLVFIDGSPITMAQMISAIFNTEDEKKFRDEIANQFISRLFSSSIGAALKEKVEACETFDSKVNQVVENADVEIIDAEFLRTIMYSTYYKLKTCSSYQPKNFKKLKAKIMLIKPTSPLFDCRLKDYGLSEYTENSIDITTVEGNHLTITDNKHCTDIINGFLEEH